MIKSLSASLILLCSVGYAYAVDTTEKPSDKPNDNLPAVMATTHIPFLIQIHTEIVQPCTLTFENPRMAMAWVQLASGELSADQFIDIAVAAIGYPLTEEKTAKMKDAIKSCITGNDL